MIDFAAPSSPAWLPVNDGVMGGLSTSSLTVTDEGTGLFSGEVSLANNGGFASVRTVLGDHALGAARGIVLRVRGDGRPYRLRLRTDRGFDGVAYQAEFPTVAGQWQEVFCPFGDFVPVFRGRPVPGTPPLDPAAVRQLGLMIADQRAGPFALEIAWIRART
ncbi:MAG: CIA30 family protein [Krumholzibacteria bacterium]|nr:CIA30 family protein [Candidatus Krumholzibacteria bacterium]